MTIFVPKQDGLSYGGETFVMLYMFVKKPQ